MNPTPDNNPETEHLKAALEASGTGTWYFNIASGEAFADILAQHHLGCGTGVQNSLQGLFCHTHPDDRHYVETAVQEAIQHEGQRLNIEYRVQAGELRRVQVKGKRTGTRICGTVQDVTKEEETHHTAKENEEKLRRMIAEAPVAVALYVGRELCIGIANDIMLSYWGKGRAVIGKRLEEAVPELEGQPFLDILDNVFTSGITYQVTEEPAKLALNGVLDTYYFDFTYQPMYDSSGKIYAIMNMAINVTDRVISKRRLEESEARFRSLIEEAPVGTCLFVGREMRVEVANNLMLGYWGKDRSVLGMPLQEAVPELKGQPFLDILDKVYTTGQPYHNIEAPARLNVNGTLGTYYFDYTYKPLLNEKGEVYAIMDMAVDVTERVMSKKRLQESEARFRAITEQSPVAIGLLKGRDMVVELGNDKIFEIWGKDRSITGKPLIEALPELEGQGFIELLEKVYDTGETHKGYDTLARLEHNGKLTDAYFDFTYSVLRGENNSITGILVLAMDVTERLLGLKKIEESEAKFRTLISSAPAAMAVFRGKDLIVDITNQAFLETVGRNESMIGRPLLESMPEIEGSESINYITEVMETGQSIHSYARQVKFIKNGELTENYYNVSYTPLFDSEGNVYAVLDTAIDVTETIKARQAIEEAEAALRGAIELADLGTWSLNPNTGKLVYSDRLLQWFGFDGEPVDLKAVFDAIHPNDRERIQNAVEAALALGSEGDYDEEYTVINRATGRERILHAQGKAFFGDDGLPYLMSGTVQDITSQKEIQLMLENEVKERTEALQKANRDLEEANRMLLNSNEELAQYAYVASHDLQEPLRKITMFSNLLGEKDTDNRHKEIIDKIVKSSQRMSLLIKDLLEFSRLLNPDIRFVATDLNEIVQAVKNDFELLVEETDAMVDIGHLPVIDAVPLQMNQLFYNLVGNALKFIPQGRKPLVTISCKMVTADEAAKYNLNYPSGYKYYRLTVSDNGIGIDPQYVKQIFDVFKRLHGRDEYSGSGIGLAICRRIVNNHGGAIYIESEIGKGASFNIILPEKQL